MSSRRSRFALPAPLRRGSTPPPQVSSPAGRRSGAVSFGLTLLGALGSGWCLISTGRALGALLASSPAIGLLAQALAAAVPKHIEFADIFYTGLQILCFYFPS